MQSSVSPLAPSLRSEASALPFASRPQQRTLISDANRVATSTKPAAGRAWRPAAPIRTVISASVIVGAIAQVRVSDAATSSALVMRASWVESVRSSSASVSAASTPMWSACVAAMPTTSHTGWSGFHSMASRN